MWKIYNLMNFQLYLIQLHQNPLGLWHHYREDGNKFLKTRHWGWLQLHCILWTWWGHYTHELIAWYGCIPKTDSKSIQSNFQWGPLQSPTEDIYIYIPKYNLFSLYNVTCIKVCMADHLVLDNQLVCSYLG